MLDKFKRLAGLGPKEKEATLVQETVTEDSVALTAALEASTVALNASNEKVAELALQLSAVSTELQALKDAQAKSVEDAKAAAMTAREAKLVEMLGTEAAPATLKALESLDDAAFAVVTDAMGAKLEAEKSSPLFAEKGVDAEVTPPETKATSEAASEAVLAQLQKQVAAFAATNP